jgi:SAM-dependent methyltransferase
VCIDLDLGRLRTVRERHAGAMAVLADATRPPLLPGRADLVVCRAITHHLPDGALEALLDEGARLLRPGGALLLLEILWPPAHGVARLLWHLDRGSNPRTAGHLRAALAARFDVVHAESFTVLHRYLLLIGRRREEGRRATVSVS